MWEDRIYRSLPPPRGRKLIAIEAESSGDMPVDIEAVAHPVMAVATTTATSAPTPAISYKQYCKLPVGKSAERRETRDASREQRAESREQRAESKEKRDERRETRAESRELC
jgi:hypothetical protein